MQEGGTINIDNVLDAGDLVPFKFGLMELQQKYEKGKPVYRLILIDREELRVLPTRADQEKERADQEKERADQEKERADQEKERADQEKECADQEKERGDQEKERADAAEARIHELEDTV